MTESALEQKLKSYVESLGGLYWKFTSPSMTGVPDRICLFKGGHVVFVEWKRPGRLSGLSEKQKIIRKKLTERGFTVLVVDNEILFKQCIDTLMENWNDI